MGGRRQSLFFSVTCEGSESFRDVFMSSFDDTGGPEAGELHNYD